jgi:hypothetical protein
MPAALIDEWRGYQARVVLCEVKADRSRGWNCLDCIAGNDTANTIHIGSLDGQMQDGKVVFKIRPLVHAEHEVRAPVIGRSSRLATSITLR